MQSKNEILRDFWETQRLKNGLNRRFWKKIAKLRLRHFRFESLLRAKRVTRLSGPIQNLWFCKWVMFLLRVYNAIKPVKTFCQVFKVEICKANTTVTWQVVIPLPIPRNIRVPRLFYARILLFTAVFGHFFFVLKYRESFWEILRDSKFRNSKSVLVRFRAFMTETFERHRSNQNRNTNWNEQKIWETFQKIMRA